MQTQDGPVEHKPIVVLVDAYTASASEITAAALSDNGLAVLVDEEIYGKGVMTAHYLTPGESRLRAALDYVQKNVAVAIPYAGAVALCFSLG